MHPFIRDYLTYSKRERRGIWVLLFILFVLILAPSFFPTINVLEEDYSRFEKEIAEFEASLKELEETERAARIQKPKRPRYKKNKTFEKKPRWVYTPPPIIDINQADSAAWISLPGIGESFTKRILKFRRLLGGFVSIEQLREVYGLDSARFLQIEPFVRLNDSLVQVININTAGFAQMIKHPYLRGSAVKWILNYRKQHGDFQKVADLRASYVITEAEYALMAPYLKVK